MDIKNKRVLIKTWKEIKECSTKAALGRIYSTHVSDTHALFLDEMKSLCGKIIQLEGILTPNSYAISHWMVQEVVECPESKEIEYQYPAYRKSEYAGQVVKFLSPTERITLVPGSNHWYCFKYSVDKIPGNIYSSFWKPCEAPVGPPRGKYIGFKTLNGNKYMFNYVLQLAVNGTGYLYEVEDQAKQLTEHYELFETANELYEWMKD